MCKYAQYHIPPIDRETPNCAGFSGFWKSIYDENWSINIFSTYLLYTLEALNDEVIVPVIIPSRNLTLNPRAVSLKPSRLPFNSVNKVNLLLGLPT